MKIALFGGSFNPLHLGHAVMADTVLTELGYDKIVFIPSFKAPHKDSKNTVSAEDRFSMVDAFCRSREDGRFIAENCEILREGTSYTVDTIKWIYENYEFDGKPGLIMGEEIAAEFHKWKDPDYIAEHTDLIVVRRKAMEVHEEKYNNIASGDYLGDGKALFNAKSFGYPFIQVENPIITISSTEIRKRIGEGKSFNYLLPPSVTKFIIEKNLYGN